MLLSQWLTTIHHSINVSLPNSSLAFTITFYVQYNSIRAYQVELLSITHTETVIFRHREVIVWRSATEAWSYDTISTYFMQSISVCWEVLVCSVPGNISGKWYRHGKTMCKMTSSSVTINFEQKCNELIYFNI